MNFVPRPRLPWPPRLLGASIALALAGWTAAPRAEDAPSADCIVTPSATIELSSAVPGVLEVVHVDRSDTVVAGQVIAELSSSVEHRDVEIARSRSRMTSDIRLWETTLGYDERNLDRVGSLHSRQVASTFEHDRAAKEAEASRWKLHRARELHALRQLELLRAADVLERRTIRSPLDGVVVRRFKSAGEYVEEQPVVRIARLDPLHVEAIVPMNLFDTIRAGDPAVVSFENAVDEVHPVTVTAVDRMGDAASGTFGVRLELPNPHSRMPAGVKCSVRFLPQARVAAHDEPTALNPQAGQTAAVPSDDIAPPVRAPAPRGTPGIASANTGSASAVEEQVETPASVALSEAIVPGLPPAPPHRGSAQATAAHSEPSQGSPASVVATCGAIGPLVDATEAGRLGKEIAAAGFRASTREVATREPLGLIVLAPAQQSRAQRAQLIARLEVRGVADHVRTGSAYQGRVALGTFERRSRAERRVEEMAGLGFEAEIVERERTETRWWVDVGKGIGGGDRRALDAIVSRLTDGVAFRAHSCPAGPAVVAESAYR